MDLAAKIRTLPALPAASGSPPSTVAVNGAFSTKTAVASRKPLKDVGGIAYRDNGRVTLTPPRPTIENMDDLPFVVDVYKRDLKIENYFIGYFIVKDPSGAFSRCAM